MLAVSVVFVPVEEVISFLATMSDKSHHSVIPALRDQMLLLDSSGTQTHLLPQSKSEYMVKKTIHYHLLFTY